MSPNTPSFPPIGQPFIVLATVDSTNNYAMAQAQEGLASHGAVYFAMEQTAGKGQRGKKWFSIPGENIALSAILQEMPLLVTNQFLLSASIALASYDFLKKYSGNENICIKWPNDLYWQDRKAGGILIESFIGSPRPGGIEQTQSDKSDKSSINNADLYTSQSIPNTQLPTVRFGIVGIGININQSVFGEEMRNPVSLKQITGKTFDVIHLAHELCECMNNRINALLTNRASLIADEYNSVLYKLNQPITLKKGNIIFETTIQGVSIEGKLRTKDVIEREFTSGEVEWRI